MRSSWLLLLGSMACGETSAPPAPAPAPAPRVAEPEPEPEAEPEPEPPPTYSERQLDAMDQPALEAACYAGSTGACDRLGH